LTVFFRGLDAGERLKIRMETDRKLKKPVWKIVWQTEQELRADLTPIQINLADV
jgi:hypothetical protein